MNQDSSMNHHRPLRHSIAPPPPIPIPTPSSRLLPLHPSHLSPFPFSPNSSSTPSKRRASSASSSSASSSSFSSLLLILFSLRSLYSLLPFIRSSPSSFSLFPFSFLVSLLSLILSLLLSLPLPSPLSLRPHFRPLAAKSSLLTLVFLLRFQALRYCGTSTTILADFSGSLVAQSLSQSYRRRDARKLLGYASLISALFFLSRSWDRTGCSPFSSSPPPPDGCHRVAPMLLPFLSGFLGFHERAASNWLSLRQLGRKRIRLASLALTTLFLFVPAFISFLRGGGEDMAAISVVGLGWPLINTVIFGVVIGEHFGDDKVVVSSGKDLRRSFTVTFFCTLVLELFYFPKLSLPGFLFCGFLLWFSVRELVTCFPSFGELGSSDPSESLYSMIMNPLRHIMRERKSRKIALFLLINTAYMVVEFVAGFMSNSLGLISDACHMLFDCAALAIGLYASYFSRLPANHHFSYGRGRFEVLSGYVNAVLLVLVGALIVLESFERILDPQEISTNSLLTVSIGGLLVNVVGLIFFHEEHHHAHGGGGGCSHSHSHHQHQHHDHHDKHDKLDAHNHHDHHHHHDAHDIVMQDHEASIEQHQCSVGSHESSGGHPHAVQINHCCNHDNHNREDHHFLHTEVQTHQSSFEHNYKHQSQDFPSKCHFSVHTNNGLHGENKSCSHKETINSSSEHHKSHSSFSKRQHHQIDHNMEGIFLHVLADTMGSLGVVVSTLLIKYKGWFVADPACSIFISIMIVSSVVPLLKNSAETLLQRVPRANEQDLKVALHDLMKVEGVCGFRNLHVWNFTNTDAVGTVHLHLSAESDKTHVKKRVTDLFHEAGIRDVTVQVECAST
ncbi:hypothetical protein J5N97_026623 [Dioscorea zingiberensis]|uniref:Cation efflux protein transmembrane domain-containing protein n=1 Tax=Dioscorea zingiberensis TaxID=325984 RepID=A0A9D5C318_9LILI|nr:hypothetical protein J5N97_026623 [Dioscorea zingiberensis]